MNQLRNSYTNSEGSTTVAKPKTKVKDSLLARIYNAIRSRIVWMYYYGRKFLWVGSTGLILLFLPMAFCYMSEVEKEMMKLGMNTAPCNLVFYIDPGGL